MSKEKQNPNSFPDSPVNPEEINFDTKTLRYIVAIVDQGGLSNAAESLFLSQPALSRYLKKESRTRSGHRSSIGSTTA